MAEKTKIHCKKCNKDMDETNFYISKNTEKYPPDGKMDICKKCLTMHVNSWEPSTFINILQEVDVPYIEQEWNGLLDKHGKDPKKVTGVTILGRYLSKMKLKQFSHLNWADTARLMEEANIKKQLVQDQMDAQLNRYAAALDPSILMGKDPDEISEEDYDNMTEEQINQLYGQPEGGPPKDTEEWKPFYENEKPVQVRPEDGLTQEDKYYLSMKWGKLYRLEEWISLERFYIEMTESFDIQGAAHINYLMMICKTQLKMNQAIDCGDIEGFQKLSKVYDNLMKSAKFTAAQNKAESGEFVDSVGELVYLAEEQGFIPRYHDDEVQDIVDKTLRDMKGYSYKLVTEEMGLGNMIEAALQQMQREQEKEEGELDEDDEYLDPENVDVLKDADYEEYYDELEEQADLDALMQKEE